MESLGTDSLKSENPKPKRLRKKFTAPVPKS